MIKSPRVLIVDRSVESRDVLRTVLEFRGASTLEAERPEHALALALRHRPDLILLDADSDQSHDGRAMTELAAVADLSTTPLVILGTLRRPTGTAVVGEIIPKPYHYGPLVRKIQELLAAA